MYVAASSINSGLVDASSGTANMGLTGKIGRLLQSVAPYVPLVGLGIQMVGAVMTQVDQNDQAIGIDNYANFVKTSTEMDNVVSEIAIFLANDAHNLTTTKIFDIDDDTYDRTQAVLSSVINDGGIKSSLQTLHNIKQVILLNKFATLMLWV
jgi:hypothetical protein